MEIKRKMQSLPLSHMAAHPSQSLSQFPKHEATWSITTPLPMLVHHKVSLLPFLPQSFITQFVCTHGYSLVERGRVKVLPKNPTHLHGQEKLKGYKIFCIADY